MYYYQVCIARDIIRRIVEIAPGVISPASFASIVSQLAVASYNILYSKSKIIKDGDDKAKVKAIYRASNINHAAAEIAFGSHEAAPVGPCQSRMASFTYKDISRNVAAAIASFCPEMIKDSSAEDLIDDILQYALHLADMANSVILREVAPLLQQYNAKSEGHTFEEIIEVSQDRAEYALGELADAYIEGATQAPRWGHKYAKNPEIAEMLKKREKTWRAPVPTYSTIPFNPTSNAALPSYSELEDTEEATRTDT